MSRQDRIDHHAARALAELECARSAACHEAAEAHLELSELHLRRMQNVRQEAPAPALFLVSDRTG
ncbi:MAG TPA: hypothetical protein VIT45_06645 [Allosphingosinicella sp.]